MCGQQDMPAAEFFKGDFVYYRLIAPKWKPMPPIEGRFTHEEITKFNAQGYNIYYLPNTPGSGHSVPVTGADITGFEWCFVDLDLKDGKYSSKDKFIEKVGSEGISPTRLVDSGHGIHVYWKVTGLDAKSYLRFQRRLCRVFNTDEATGMLFQLMRAPGTINTKDKDFPVPCTTEFESDASYTAEELDRLLPPIIIEDESFCQTHYDKTYGLNQDKYNVDETIPPKFGKLLRDNAEAKQLWTEPSDDRSKADYRLAHLMFATGFTKEEGASVLVNSAKALQRAPIHRRSYATNIIDKIWTFEVSQNKEGLGLSQSVKEILTRSGDTLKGTPFRCHERIDNTKHGYRLGQVIGLVGGSGIGKTAVALNKFRWFAQKNPDYHHFFVPLEQPANEIADRWKTMCGDDTSLHDKVHVLSNYNEDGTFRHLSLDEIKEYIEKFQKLTGHKVGCVVIDHIGALKKKGKDGENQDLMDICHQMKAFAIQTNTLLIMQSQSSRAKAGIGDIELDKDAAYGTMYFEAYCDYLITLWQPLKRVQGEDSCPTITAFKFCKIRHKSKGDIIIEDTPYYLYFDQITEQLTDLTQDQKISFDYFLPKATNKRKGERKSELVQYKSVDWRQNG